MATVTTDTIPLSLDVVVSIRAATYAEAVTEMVAQVTATPSKSLTAFTRVMVAAPEEHFLTLYLG